MLVTGNLNNILKVESSKVDNASVVTPEVSVAASVPLRLCAEWLLHPYLPPRVGHRGERGRGEERGQRFPDVRCCTSDPPCKPSSPLVTLSYY
jgi:hypothetical protein